MSSYGISEALANAIVDTFRLAKFRPSDVARASEWDTQMRARLVGAGASYAVADAILETHSIAAAPDSVAEASNAKLLRKNRKSENIEFVWCLAISTLSMVAIAWALT